jgi:hypothetical protein
MLLRFSGLDQSARLHEAVPRHRSRMASAGRSSQGGGCRQPECHCERPQVQDPREDRAAHARADGSEFAITEAAVWSIGHGCIAGLDRARVVIKRASARSDHTQQPERQRHHKAPRRPVCSVHRGCSLFSDRHDRPCGSPWSEAHRSLHGSSHRRSPVLRARGPRPIAPRGRASGGRGAAVVVEVRTGKGNARNGRRKGSWLPVELREAIQLC